MLVNGTGLKSYPIQNNKNSKQSLAFKAKFDAADLLNSAIIESVNISIAHGCFPNTVLPYLGVKTFTDSIITAGTFLRTKMDITKTRELLGQHHPLNFIQLPLLIIDRGNELFAKGWQALKRSMYF